MKHGYISFDMQTSQCAAEWRCPHRPNPTVSLNWKSRCLLSLIIAVLCTRNSFQIVLRWIKGRICAITTHCLTTLILWTLFYQKLTNINEQPQNSLDLVPCEFFLSTNPKSALHGRQRRSLQTCLKGTLVTALFVDVCVLLPVEPILKATKIILIIQNQKSKS